jgi:hypothetical protein
MRDLICNGAVVACVALALVAIVASRRTARRIEAIEDRTDRAATNDFGFQPANAAGTDVDGTASRRWHLRHRWTPWSDGEEVAAWDGWRRVRTTALEQERRCATCNLTIRRLQR